MYTRVLKYPSPFTHDPHIPSIGMVELHCPWPTNYPKHFHLPSNLITLVMTTELLVKSLSAPKPSCLTDQVDCGREGRVHVVDLGKAVMMEPLGGVIDTQVLERFRVRRYDDEVLVGDIQGLVDPVCDPGAYHEIGKQESDLRSRQV